MTLADARARAREILDLARRGVNPVEEPRHRADEERAETARRAGLSVLAVVERHLDSRRATLRPATLSQYEFTMKALRESPLAARQLHEVKRGEVREALRAISRELGPGSARKVKTLVRAAARWAAAEDLLPTMCSPVSACRRSSPGGGTEYSRTRRSSHSGVLAMITPGSPQQNGAHERMHKTLKAKATKPPAANLNLQQRVFNSFRHTYNELRPHEALDDDTPASRWTSSTRTYPERIVPPDYPAHLEVRRVSNAGCFQLHSGQIFLSQALNGEDIGLEEVQDGVWNILYYDTLLGRFDERTKAITASLWLTRGVPYQLQSPRPF